MDLPDGVDRRPSGASAPAFVTYQIAELETIEYGVDDGIAHVRLNRPQRRNAIDLRMADETLTVARAIAGDTSVRAVLFTGNGPAFSVGGDIQYFRQHPPETYGAVFARMTESFHEALRILAEIEVPVVTAVHGVVVGAGLGYLYAADIAVAAEETDFMTAFSGVGLPGDGGGTWHLPRLVGLARARRMYLEDLRIDAATALDWGLVADVVPGDELAARAHTAAEKLASGPTLALGAQRRHLAQSWTRTFPEALRAETEELRRVAVSNDTGEAIAAFAGRRQPRFEGR